METTLSLYLKNKSCVFQVVLNHEELKLAMFMSKTLISSIISFTKRNKLNTEERNRKSTDIYEERNRPPFGPSKDVYNSLEAPIFIRPDLRNDYSASNSSRGLDTRSRGTQKSQYSMSRDPFAPIPPVIAPLPPVIRDNDYPIVSRPRVQEDRPRNFETATRYPRDEYQSKNSGHREEADLGFDQHQHRGLRGDDEDYKLSKRIR